MDSVQRRQTASRAAQLIARGAVGLAVLVLLARLFAGAGASDAADVPPVHPLGVPEATVAGAPSPEVDPSPGLPAGNQAAERRIDERLTAAIRAKIRFFVDKAHRAVPSRVSASDVQVSVHVRERGVPGDLVAIGSDRPMRPASNMKLVTSAAALVLLGPAWSFETAFEVVGPVRDGRLEGPLVVRAAGDPFYDATGGPGAVPLGLFEPLLRALEAEGVRSIEGGLVLDEGSFAEPGPGPAWPSSNQFDQEYCALSGGFTIGAGCLTATVRSRGVGRRASVSVAPEGHGLREEFEVESIAARKPLVVHVQGRGKRVTVRGRIPVDVKEWSTRFAYDDPVGLFGNVLKSRLEAASIAVGGPVLRERGVPAGREIARLATPLTETLAPINTDSNNAVADQVFFAIGNAIVGRGTRAGGSAATALALERLGVPVAGLVQVDGSGLSRDDRMSTRQITALVDAVLALDPLTAEALLDSLAVAGRTGKLKGRMQGIAGKVRAKTGFIDGTSALSGVVETADGRTLVFSILVEYPVVGGLNTKAWKPMQDAICVLMAGVDG